MLEEMIAEMANKPPVWVAPPESGNVDKLSNEALALRLNTRTEKYVSSVANFFV
jgi:hypothetical protein